MVAFIRVLSPISGLFRFYGPLSYRLLGAEAPFLLFVKKGDHLDPNIGKIISGNIVDHEEDTLGIILSPISGL